MICIDAGFQFDFSPVLILKLTIKSLVLEGLKLEHPIHSAFYGY
jgi:hypothetical protein